MTELFIDFGEGDEADRITALVAGGEVRPFAGFDIDLERAETPVARRGLSARYSRR